MYSSIIYCQLFVDARNGSQEKKQRKAKTKMGERHHIYVWYDGSSKQSGGGQAPISQRHLGRDVLARICFEKKFVDDHVNICWVVVKAFLVIKPKEMNKCLNKFD